MEEAEGGSTREHRRCRYGRRTGGCGDGRRDPGRMGATPGARLDVSRRYHAHVQRRAGGFFPARHGDRRARLSPPLGRNGSRTGRADLKPKTLCDVKFKLPYLTLNSNNVTVSRVPCRSFDWIGQTQILALGSGGRLDGGSRHNFVARRRDWDGTEGGDARNGRTTREPHRARRV